MSKKIDVTIAGRTFPVKVSEQEVAAIRQIEKDLNQSISDFNLKYKDRDKLDCVIMTLLTVAVDKAEQSASNPDSDEIHTQLEKINQLLEVNLS